MHKAHGKYSTNVNYYNFKCPELKKTESTYWIGTLCSREKKYKPKILDPENLFLKYENHT